MGVKKTIKKKPTNKKAVKDLAEEIADSIETASEDLFGNGIGDDDEYEDENHESEEYSNGLVLENDSLPTLEEIKAKLDPFDFDIFTDLGEKYALAGDTPRYEITKNNQMLTSVNHPYSWDKIQKEFGGGHYKVKMRSGTTGGYVKHQTKSIADIPENEKANDQASSNENLINFMNNMNNSFREQQMESDEKSRIREEKFQEQLNRQTSIAKEESANNQNNMFAMITAMLSKPQDTSASEANNTNMLMMMKMMEMNKPVDKTSDITQLILTMQQNNMAIMEKMNETNARAFEKMSDKIADMGKQDDKGMSPLELVTFFQSAQTQGMDQMKLINAMVEEKSANNDSGSDDDSITKTLIKSVVPMVGQLAQIANAQKETAQAVIPSNHQQTNQLPPTRSQRSEIQAKTQRKRPSNQGNINANRQNTKGNSQLPRPKVANVQSVVAQNSKSDKIEVSEQKKIALEILFPFIGEALMSGKEAKATAIESIPKLTEKGLDPVLVIPQFSGEELIKIAGGMGINDAEYKGLNDWLKGYYDEILHITTSQTREFTANQ